MGYTNREMLEWLARNGKLIFFIKISVNNDLYKNMVIRIKIEYVCFG
jgi:hypothetical protein